MVLVAHKASPLDTACSSISESLIALDQLAKLYTFPIPFVGLTLDHLSCSTH